LALQHRDAVLRQDLPFSEHWSQSGFLSLRSTFDSLSPLPIDMVCMSVVDTPPDRYITDGPSKEEERPFALLLRLKQSQQS